ncbi:astacin, partial [Necator americanus]
LRNAAHEIGHSLGLFHTQSRHDRDSYITFNAHNVQHGWVSEYNKETEETNYNYGLAYDYGSIMHYGAHSSSRNTLPTMIPRDTKYLETLGSAIISFNDLYMINKHYNCTAKCDPSKSAKCKRGGYPHPRNCAKCICPGGYGGDLCDKRPDDGCGKVFQATSSYQYFQAEVGDRQAGRKARVDFTTCTYWIKVYSAFTLLLNDMMFLKSV